VNPGELAILPAPDAEQVAHDIALLLAVQLRHVLVSTHLEGLRFVKKKILLGLSFDENLLYAVFYIYIQMTNKNNLN
jgi:hypothetical protein